VRQAIFAPFSGEPNDWLDAVLLTEALAVFLQDGLLAVQTGQANPGEKPC
jgi:hypothetical protein